MNLTNSNISELFEVYFLGSKKTFVCVLKSVYNPPNGKGHYGFFAIWPRQTGLWVDKRDNMILITKL